VIVGIFAIGVLVGLVLHEAVAFAWALVTARAIEEMRDDTTEPMRFESGDDPRLKLLVREYEDSVNAQLQLAMELELKTEGGIPGSATANRIRRRIALAKARSNELFETLLYARVER
jgi:hypothetical protein